MQYVLPGEREKCRCGKPSNVLAQERVSGLLRLRVGEGLAPGIEEPEVAFPHYASLMRRALADAGVKPVAS